MLFLPNDKIDVLPKISELCAAVGSFSERLGAGFIFNNMYGGRFG